jgi:hypothetical protein
MSRNSAPSRRRCRVSSRADDSYSSNVESPDHLILETRNLNARLCAQIESQDSGRSFPQKNKLPINMFPEDRCLRVCGVGEDGVAAFTEYGIECPKQLVADERAAGTAPPKVRSTESRRCGAHRMPTEQLDLQALHRVRAQLVSQRTGIINRIRAFLLQRGIAIRRGPRFLSRGSSFVRSCSGAAASLVYAGIPILQRVMNGLLCCSVGLGTA